MAFELLNEPSGTCLEAKPFFPPSSSFTPRKACCQYLREEVTVDSVQTVRLEQASHGKGQVRSQRDHVCVCVSLFEYGVCTCAKAGNSLDSQHQHDFCTTTIRTRTRQEGNRGLESQASCNRSVLFLGQHISLIWNLSPPSSHAACSYRALLPGTNGSRMSAERRGKPLFPSRKLPGSVASSVIVPGDADPVQ